MKSSYEKLEESVRTFIKKNSGKKYSSKGVKNLISYMYEGSSMKITEVLDLLKMKLGKRYNEDFF